MKIIKTKIFFICAMFVFCAPSVYAEDIITDSVAPVITLSGSADVSVNEGETYTDLGAQAIDDIDGDITSNIVVSGSVDTSHIGTYTLTYTVSDSALNEATPVTRIVNVIPLSETVLIRSGDNVVFSGTVALPQSGTISILDSVGVPHDVNTRSVLGLLYALDETNDAFSISNLIYYSSFNAFYFKCITIAGGNELCDNWQYVVNNTTPWQSIDASILNGGETVGLYFGQPHHIVTSSSSLSVGDSLTVTAEQYNYINNTWAPLLGVTTGATVPNPNDPYNPIVVTSSPVNEHGVATLSFSQVGTYSVGIAEDYYFPSVDIQVSERGGSGGGSGDGGETTASFSVEKAVAYLASVQDDNGSFGGNDMYTDWVAVALGSYGHSQSLVTKILEYMKSHNLSHPLLTDFERRAMSILALGKNPYNFEGNDYITPIVNSFDGKQFGDESLVNDDVFALIPLARAGYKSNDTIISQDIIFVLSKQNANGSWEESVDMTASAIQALSLFSDISGVSESINKARTYLENIQSTDGGFGSVYSTSWVLQAESLLGVSFVKNGNSAKDYLARAQITDGGVLSVSDSTANRIWATSYAIPAVLGKSWGSILSSVSKSVAIKRSDSDEQDNSIKKDFLFVDDQKLTVLEVVPDPLSVEKQKTKNKISVSEKNISSDVKNNIPSESQLASAGNSKKRIPRPIVAGAIVLGVAGFTVARFLIPIRP